MSWMDCVHHEVCGCQWAMTSSHLQRVEAPERRGWGLEFTVPRGFFRGTGSCHEARCESLAVESHRSRGKPPLHQRPGSGNDGREDPKASRASPAVLTPIWRRGGRGESLLQEKFSNG